MSIKTRLVDYRDGELVFEGLLAWDDSIDVSGKQVVVIGSGAIGRSAHLSPLVQMTYVRSTPMRLHLAMVPLHPKSTSSG